MGPHPLAAVPAGDTRHRRKKPTMKLVTNETPSEVASTESEMKRIASYIAKPPENSRIFTITSEMAAALLTNYNQGNRSPKPRNIERYASDMEAGDWALTGDTIKFSDKGVLRDGQNRLMACVRSGVPFTTHVVFGISDEFFDRMDRGKTRDGSDLLAISGVPYSTTVSSAIRWVHLIDTGRVKTREGYDSRQTLQLFQTRYSELLQFVPQARKIYGVTRQPPSLVAALLFQFERANSAKAQEFANAWESGLWSGRFKAIGLVQSELASLHSITKGRIHDVVRAALIVKAWNLFISGRHGRKNEIMWTLAEDFPQIRGE